MVWIDVMDITKWSISGSEKSVPANTGKQRKPRACRGFRYDRKKKHLEGL